MKSTCYLAALTVLTSLIATAQAQVPNTLYHSVDNPGTSAQSGTRQGQSVAVDGGFTVVGCPSDDLGGENSGSVKVYDTATGALRYTLPNPHGAGNSFGWSVAISGTRVVVGAYMDNTGAAATGRAYVFDLAGATPTVPVTILNNPSPTVQDRYGWAVAASGKWVVVGAYLADPYGPSD